MLKSEAYSGAERMNGRPALHLTCGRSSHSYNCGTNFGDFGAKIVEELRVVYAHTKDFGDFSAGVVGVR